MTGVGLWGLALALTLAAAAYQRRTGPTHPMRGEFTLAGERFTYALPRTHGGAGGQEVVVTAPAGATGEAVWRHYPSNHPWQRLPMAPDSGLRVILPHLPPAGKMEYYLRITAGAETVELPGAGGCAVIRYKGAVPAVVLIPHVLCMFGAMLLANRAGMEAIRPEGGISALTVAVMTALVLGGLIFGPLVQYYAFGAFWTGFPFGHDLTDNKILLAFIAWLFPFVRVLRRRPSRAWVIVAAAVMFAVFMIPHSLLGSELQWDTLPAPG
ncbi:hypothetical protein JW905_08650 [bacterium]|nr:hypothetical protein [candidate division CSSED10-310 bacterium]